jgi:hypothetical protein
MDSSTGFFLGGPSERIAFGCAEAGGKVYLFGGRLVQPPLDGSREDGSFARGSEVSDTWVFDPVKIEWTDLSRVAGSAPPPRQGFGMASADGIIFIYGGRSWAERLNDESYTDTWSFNPSVASWTNIDNVGPSLTGHNGAQLAAADGGDGRARIYLFEGRLAAGPSSSSTIQGDSMRPSKTLAA